jgi:hypothetical protein
MRGDGCRRDHHGSPWQTGRSRRGQMEQVRPNQDLVGDWSPWRSVLDGRLGHEEAYQERRTVAAPSRRATVDSPLVNGAGAAIVAGLARSDDHQHAAPKNQSNRSTESNPRGSLSARVE